MEKEDILEAIESGDYAVEFEPADSIYECTKYDGSKFYVFEDLDGPKSSTDMGTFTVSVQVDDEQYEFIYDMNCGDWEGDELCNDEDVIEALESIDEFISYDDYDGDKQWEIYANANHIHLNSDFYFSENEDSPKDIGELGNGDADVPLKYYIPTGQGTTCKSAEMVCTISDKELYNLYLMVKDELDGGIVDKEGNSEKDEDTAKRTVELSACEIKTTYPKLHKTILKQVHKEACRQEYNSENGPVNFVVCLSKEVLENNL